MYQPAPLKQEMKVGWWLERKPYTLFIVRELSSLFVAAYAIIMMLKLHALSRGPQAWESLMATFSSPGLIVLHVVIFAFVLFHAISWFRLSPLAVELRIGGRKIPDSMIITANVILWLLLSVAIIWIVAAV